MKTSLILKIALWLILLGTAAQLTPNPAWPRALAQGVFWSGVAIGLGVLLLWAWRFDRARNQRRRG